MANVRKTNTLISVLFVYKAEKHRKLFMASSDAFTEHQNMDVGDGSPLKNSTVSLVQNKYKKIDGMGPIAPNHRYALSNRALREGMIIFDLFPPY